MVSRPRRFPNGRPSPNVPAVLWSSNAFGDGSRSPLWDAASRCTAMAAGVRRTASSTVGATTTQPGTSGTRTVAVPPASMAMAMAYSKLNSQTRAAPAPQGRGAQRAKAPPCAQGGRVEPCVRARTPVVDTGGEGCHRERRIAAPSDGAENHATNVATERDSEIGKGVGRGAVRPWYTNAGQWGVAAPRFARRGRVDRSKPFNIASYALLTHLFAHVVGFRPGELIIALGDVHLYLDHIDNARLQLTRAPDRCRGFASHAPSTTSTASKLTISSSRDTPPIPVSPQPSAFGPVPAGRLLRPALTPPIPRHPTERLDEPRRQLHDPRLQPCRPHRPARPRHPFETLPMDFPHRRPRPSTELPRLRTHPSGRRTFIPGTRHRPRDPRRSSRPAPTRKVSAPEPSHSGDASHERPQTVQWRGRRRMHPLPAPSDIDDFRASDFLIEEYDPHPHIPAAVSI